VARKKKPAAKKPAAKKKPATNKKPAKKLPAITQQHREALVASVEDYAQRNYPARDVVPLKCRACPSELFEVEADDTEGCARRRCVRCKTEHFYLDSEEYWDDADPEQCICTCEKAVFHTAVGFARTLDEKDVKWVYIGLRCVACGLAGVYADWKIDYSPSLGLLRRA